MADVKTPVAHPPGRSGPWQGHRVQPQSVCARFALPRRTDRSVKTEPILGALGLFVQVLMTFAFRARGAPHSRAAPAR